MKTCARLLVFLLLAAVLLAGTATAAPAMADEGFTITNFDVNAVISDTNVYTITETINADFTQAKHGIYRDIPVNQDFNRVGANGTTVTTRVRSSVSNVSVEGYSYTVSRFNGDNGSFIRIKIGDPDYTVTGRQTYKITYNLKFGNDGVNDFDEVYYNIIGTSWLVPIDRVTFSVTLPKDFDASKLGFSIGSAGSSGYDPEDLHFNVDGNTVTGTVLRGLSPYEAVTMRVELPQGYFRVPDLKLPDWLMMGLIVALVLLSILLFSLFGRDDKPVQTVEFYAPDGLTPAEIGYINDGCVDTRDVVSLVMYWADKGYLTIEDLGGNSFQLNKVKDIGSSGKPFEEHMFNKLFKDGSTVTTEDLKYTFYTTINSTKAMVGDSFDRDDRRVFTKVSMGLKPLLSFLAALPVMLTLFLTLWRDNWGFIPTCMATIILGLVVLLPVFFLISTMRTWRGQKQSVRIIKLLCALFLCFIAVVVFLIVAEMTAFEPLLPWFAALATVFIGLCAVFISKRTPKGVEWLGKIMGFREFIVLAERDRLVMLVAQNPSYFYNILPYAYVLNVTDKWAKNFETIALQPPDWYYGYPGAFHPMLFVGSLNNSMSAMQSSMSSMPSSSGSGGGGGGGFSGGGFSGGGGGGGGGGSW
jgi:uncharacterized membrane protein YgcG